MKDYESLKDLFQDTADAIRECGQTEEVIIAEDFPDAIRNLPTSSVNIIDIYSAEDLERECAKQEAGKLYRYLGPTIGEYYINDNIYESINGYPGYHQENEYDIPKVKTAEEMEYLFELYSENQIFQTVQYIGKSVQGSQTCGVDKKYIHNSIYSLKTSKICKLSEEYTHDFDIPSQSSVTMGFDSQYSAHGNGVYVLLGGDNVYYSSDLDIWQPANLPTSLSTPQIKFACVIFANNMFVASRITYEDNNNIIYSYDGINWFAANENGSFGGDSIAYGTTSEGVGRFVIISKEQDSNMFCYSDDGINWINKYEFPDRFINEAKIHYAKDRFFVNGGIKRFYYSYDGLNWLSDIQMPDYVAWQNSIKSQIIYNEDADIFVIFEGGSASDRILISTDDGKTFYRYPSWGGSGDRDYLVHFEGTFVKALYKNGLYIVLTCTDGGSGYLYYSPTIQDWDAWENIITSADALAMFDIENDLIKILMTDGITTCQIKETWFKQGKILDAKMTNNPRFLMDGVNLNRADTYLDLQNHKIYEINIVEENTQWKRGGDLPITTYWRDAAVSDDGTIVAVGGANGSSGNINKAAYSTDGGETWHAVTLPSTSHWRSVAYGNGKFVATAYTYYTKSGDTEYNYITNRAAYSTDGINWTAATMPTSGCWTVTYGNGKFVAVGGAGYSVNRAAYSTDGINWTAATMPSAAYWSDVAYGKGLYVAVTGFYSSSVAEAGTTDKFAYSTDGINWTEGTMPKAMAWNSITFNEKTGYFLATAEGYYNDGLYITTESLAYSSNGKNWYMMKGSEYNSFMKIITSPYNYNLVLIGRSISDRKGIYYSTNQIIPQWQNYNGTLNLSLGAGVYAKNKFVVISNNGKESYYCYDNLLDAKKDDLIITEYTGTKIEAV